MGKPRAFGDLEVGYNPGHERREWRLQRIGWSGMALAAVAALAGLLGPGPLSNAQAGSEHSPLRAEYQRFGRYQAPAELRLFCRPPKAGEFEISIDRSFLESAEIQEISPEPKTWIAGGERAVLSFDAEGTGRQLVTLRFQSRTFGTRRCRIALNDANEIELQQFFWP